MQSHPLREKWAEPPGTKAEDPAKYTTAPVRSLQREMVGICHLKKYKFMGLEFSKLKTKSLAVLPEIALLDRGLQDEEGAGWWGVCAPLPGKCRKQRGIHSMSTKEQVMGDQFDGASLTEFQDSPMLSAIHIF